MPFTSPLKWDSRPFTEWGGCSSCKSSWKLVTNHGAWDLTFSLMTLPPNPINISCGKTQRKIKGCYFLDPTTFSNNVTVTIVSRQQHDFLHTAPAIPPSFYSFPSLPWHKPNLRACVVETTTPGTKNSHQFHAKNVVFNILFKIFSTLLSAVLKRIIAHAWNSARYVNNTGFGNNEFTQNIDHWETVVLFSGQEVCNKHL